MSRRGVISAFSRFGWDWAAAILIAALVVLVAATFRDYGISNDEEVQHHYGELLVRFFSSGFVDRSAFQFKDLFYYGGLFDIAAIPLADLLPFETYETRHLLSAAIGVLGVVAVWRLGRALAGPRTGFFAAALLALTGAWYGGMFNHTKDVPFATAMAWGLFFICRLIGQFPKPRLMTIVGLGVATGASLGIRVGGLLLFVYAALAVGIWLLGGERRSSLMVMAHQAGSITVRLLPAGILAFAIMAFSWPWAVLDPLNPLRALEHFSNVKFPINTILAGQVMRVYDVPASYLPIYFLIKLPLILLIGLLLSVVYLAYRRLHLAEDLPRSSPVQHRGLIMTAVAAGFPIVWFVIDDLPASDGIRHFLFALPPMAVLAGFGLDRFLVVLSLRSRLPARLAGVGIAGALLLQASVLSELHPYENVDYNVLVGGLAGAQRKYVMDYWANTVPEATRALAAYVKSERRKGAFSGPYKVFVCSERESFVAVAPPYLIWTRHMDKADFFIAPTHMNCDAPPDWPARLLRGKTIYQVKRLGVVLAVVRDRRDVIATGPHPPRS